jgi:hypothetical protein
LREAPRETLFLGHFAATVAPRIVAGRPQGKGRREPTTVGDTAGGDPPDLAHDDEVDACSGALEMLNPHMKSWGIFEATRLKAEQLRAEQRDKPQPTQTAWAPGSMEWEAEQEKLKAEREKLKGGGG